MNKKINNHFIQKAFAKNFANKGELNWIEYNTDKSGTFHIKNTPNEKQPIVKQKFHSEQIENGMNKLESFGVNVIKKIARESQFNDKVELSRKELMGLKFYSILSGARTNKLRNNIKNKTGDSLFNAAVTNSELNPKEIQEKIISIILESWEENKKEIVSNYSPIITKYLEGKSDDVIRDQTIVNISNELHSRLLIFKFDSMSLMLNEAMNFTEQNMSNGGILLSFMPIFPNIGIAFYFDPLVMRGMGMTKQKSVIFKNDISRPRNIVDYVNDSLMREKRLEFISNHPNPVKANFIWTASERAKYYTKDDRYVYEVLKEKGEVADLCNAMSLVHATGSIVIYQKKEDIERAESQISKRGIFRIEDVI